MTLKILKVALHCSVAIAVLGVATVACAQTRTFNIPSEEALVSIPEFARQAGIQIIAPSNELHGVQTPAIKGALDAHAALTNLLKGTGLEVSTYNGSVVSLRKIAPPGPPSPVTARVPSPVAQGPPGNARVEEVIVTGSRVANGVNAPTPVTVVTSDQITQTARPSLADGLIQLPALRYSFTSAKGGLVTAGGSFLNLRGLNANRTLVLVDGRRFVSTSQTGVGLGSVNVETIPQGLVKRVDLVTGGASAQYGSDAVAGVVNFIIDKNFEGLKGYVQGGQTQYNDGRNYTGALTAGGAFAEGKGHIVVDAEYSFDGGIPPDYTGLKPARPDWMGQPNGELTVPGRPAGVFAVIPNARIETEPLGGLVSGGIPTAPGSTSTILWAFNPDGTRNVGYNPGSIAVGLQKCSQPTSAGGGGSTSTVNGCGTGALATVASGGNGWNPGGLNSLDQPAWRSSIYTRVGYDLTPKLNVYIEALTASNTNKATLAMWTPQVISGSATPIYADNAYLQPDLKAALNNIGISTAPTAPGASPTVAFKLDKAFEGEHDTLRSQTQRVVAGADYQFNDNWSGELYYEFGTTQGSLTWKGNQNNIALKNALDAVTVTAANRGNSGLAIGSIACRSTLTDPGNGCAPYDPFGTTFLTGAAKAYISPDDTFTSQNTETVVEGSVTGTLFKLPAGDLKVAFGGGYRKETLFQSTDSAGLSALANPFTGAQGALGFGSSPGAQGGYDIGEAFAEAEVPLLKGLPFVKSLDLNIAGRYSDYSTVGGVSTWKVGLVYAPNDWVRFRATESQDIRAPNVTELFSGRTAGFSQITDPVTNTSYGIVPYTGGNKDLKPEKGDTFTGGIVFTPTILPGAYASLDYYSIKISGEIAAPSAARVINFCYNGTTTPQNPEYCSKITRAPSDPVTGALGQILSLNTAYVNLAEGIVQGLDLELGYNHPLNLFGIQGEVASRLYANYVLKNSTQVPLSAAIDTAKDTGRATLLVTGDYKAGPWDMGVQEHWISGGLVSALALRDIKGNYIRFPGDSLGGQWTTDLALRRSFGTWEIYGSIINLFNANPHLAPFQQLVGIGTGGLVGDVQGRRFQIGARFKI